MGLGGRWLAVGVLGAMAMTAVGAPTSKPPAAASSGEIAKLIESLGDKSYTVRQWAEEQLGQIGYPAYEALEVAAQHEDLEIAARARYLLRTIEPHFVSDQDPPEVKKLLDEYGRGPAADRVEEIDGLAALRDLKGTAALCRIVRGEPSAALSAWAALAILYHEPADQPSRTRLKELCQANLAGSNRPATRWLLTHAQLRDDPNRGLLEWTRLVESELDRWQRTPEKTNAEAVVGLLYLLAGNEADAGDRAAAEKTAERARRLPPPAGHVALEVRLRTVSMLARRGLAAWLEADCRLQMDSGNPDAVINASRILAEHLHDQGKDLAAADTYQRLFDQLNQLGPNVVILSGRDLKPSEVGLWLARMNYFRGCHWSREHDAAKAVAFLEQAFQANPGDADILIACWRVADAPPRFREWVTAQIDFETARLRSLMAKDGAPAASFNNFAWLVCNTKGDLDEALRASQKSLQMSPGAAGYLDTLAHVYFAKGDLPSAVKYQTMAVEREPYAGILIAELKRFREALEEKDKK